MRLNREIIRLTIPAIVSNITMPLLGLADTTVSGHLGSEIYIAAIAVGTMMQNVVFWLFGFLRMGTTGLTAQAFGADDHEQVKMAFWRSLLLGVALGVCIIAMRGPLKDLLLLLIGPQGGVRVNASHYFDICILGAPAMLATMSIQGWLLGMQTTLLPMSVTVTVNLLNIGLSLLFTFGFGMGFEGVAYGTLAATWCGLIPAMIAARIKSRGKGLRLPWRKIADHDGLIRFFKVNSDIMLRSACIISVSMTVTAIGARLGAMTLASNAIIIQFYIFYAYCMDGFAFTGEALCGRFAGARQHSLLIKAVRLLLMWSAVMALLFTSTYLIAYREIIGFITNEPSVIETTCRYRLWIFLTPTISTLAFIYDGFFIGLTATRRMLWATATAALTFMAVAFVHPQDTTVTFGLPNNDLLWAAFLSYLFLRGFLLAIQSRSVFSLYRPLPQQQP